MIKKNKLSSTSNSNFGVILHSEIHVPHGLFKEHFLRIHDFWANPMLTDYIHTTSRTNRSVSGETFVRPCEITELIAGSSLVQQSRFQHPRYKEDIWSFHHCPTILLEYPSKTKLPRLRFFFISIPSKKTT